MRALILAALLVGGAIGPALAQDGPPPGPPGAGERGPRGPLFISPMGEPFRGGEAPQDQWFDGADSNHDGALTIGEMTADAARFFALLDMRKDGEIDPDDIERYETVLVPEVRVGGGGGGGGMRGMRGGRGGHGGGRGRGGMGGGVETELTGTDEGGPRKVGLRDRNMPAMKQGAGRFGYLDYPQPITVADRNFNRGVDRDEWTRAAEARFDMLDINRDGKIEKGELPKLSRGPGGGGGGKPRDGREPLR